MKMARYFGDSVASNSRATSEPLKISGQRRGCLALGMPAVMLRPLSPRVEASRQRMAARFTLRVSGDRPRRTSSRRNPSTSVVVIPVGTLPAWARNRRAHRVNVLTVLGRSPRSAMYCFIRSTALGTSLISDMGNLLGLGKAKGRLSPVGEHHRDRARRCQLTTR